MIEERIIPLRRKRKRTSQSFRPCRNCGKGSMDHRGHRGIRFCPVLLSHPRFANATLADVAYSPEPKKEAISL